MKESSALILLLAGLTSQVSIIQRSTRRSEMRTNYIKPTLDMPGYEIFVSSAHINLNRTLFQSGFQSLQDLIFLEDAMWTLVAYLSPHLTLTKTFN